MGADLHQLRQGTVVWATMRDVRGFRKRRPAIVITPTDEIAADEPLALVAITTTYPEPPPASHIELPWHPDSRRTLTGLGRRSAAVADWVDSVYADEIDEIVGRAPPRLIAQILRHISGGGS